LLVPLLKKLEINTYFWGEILTAKLMLRSRAPRRTTETFNAALNPRPTTRRAILPAGGALGRDDHRIFII
jgi:hypothetical protein